MSMTPSLRCAAAAVQPWVAKGHHSLPFCGLKTSKTMTWPTYIVRAYRQSVSTQRTRDTGLLASGRKRPTLVDPKIKGIHFSSGK